ncbi:hypothetical protein ACFV6F_09310 [Kitasatospora phosalacinea]|uniref:hypothetical protein n=1 Tax=Kitasatospora phosalacinea TaxID=2065 RepID=UPI00366A18A9
MSAIESSAGKPKNLRCEKCNSHTEAVHLGTREDDAGHRVDHWGPGPCSNPQCSGSGPGSARPKTF